MNKVAIIGAGGNARELAEMLRAWPDIQFLGFLADTRGRYDSDAIGDFDWPATHEVDSFVMGIGDPVTKFRLGNELLSRYPGVAWPVLIHPTAYVGSSVNCDYGVVVGMGSIVTANVRIGAFTQLNYGCTVGHEAILGPACLINPGANISGGVQLGRSVMVGTGSQILQYRTVGDEARIGAGAVVTEDVQPGATVVGVPAKPRVKGPTQ